MIRSSTKEKRIAEKRGWCLVFICFLLLLIIFFRLFFLQIIEGAAFKELKNENITKTNYITPVRGFIYDTNGVELAGNRNLFNLMITPESIRGFALNKEFAIKQFIKEISEVLSIDKSEQERLVRKIIRTPSFVSTLVKSDLTMDEVALITSNSKYIKSLRITSLKIRDYKFNGEYLSVIGYVGKVSQKDLKSNQNYIITNLDYVGKSGLEKIYNESLMGLHGEEQIGINAYGRKLMTIKTKSSTAGKSLTLTLDSKLQTLAYSLLEGQTGAVVALNPETGAVLALVSVPTYDPNKLIKGISQKEYNKYFLGKNGSPFFNRAISGQYPPASTIKPFMLMAALIGNWADKDKRYWCGPYYKIKGSSRKFNDWKPMGHGWINMRESLERSADVYYYRLGERMGIDYIHDTMSLFNLGKKSGINLIGEKDGLIPSTQWKKEAKKESWYTGETLIASIGQGFMMTTPMQLAQAVAILVSNGKYYKPRLIKTEPVKLLYDVKFKKSYVSIIKNGMRDVIFGKYGTARRWKNSLVRYDQGGKTGTSQVYSTNGNRPDKDGFVSKKLRDHSLYIGFAPFDHPKIVISVIIENSGGEVSASPIGIKIMQKFLDENYPDLETKNNTREYKK